MTVDPGGLPALERRAAHELAILAYPAIDWVVGRKGPDGRPALDCAIIGAGMFGLAIGGLLRREKVDNIALFDQAPPGQEGPWATFARMAMLRTPKDLSGPELGIPSLSFRAWWEAQHGEAAWEAMYRVPRTAWMDYLTWFRQVTGLPVNHGWRLVSMEPDGDFIRLGFETPEGPATRFARSVVLSTGGKGGGGHAIPPAIAAAVPKDRVVHAMDVFDPTILHGRRVGILGSGASAFDLAIAALHAGATRAEVAVRRAELPRDNPRRWMENAGFLAHYADLPDAVKWAYAHRLHGLGQPPPQPTFDAAMALPGFAMRTAFPWDSVQWTGSEIVVEGGGQRARYDHLAIATGFVSNLALRPEMAAVVPHAARWADRYQPPPGMEDAASARALYVDRHGGLQEKVPGAAPWLSRIFTIIGATNLIPGFVQRALPRDRYAHTAEPIDFAALAGKRVAVLGAGASAFDNAGTALEAGAARVDLLARRAEIPRVNPNRWIEFAGFLGHFAALPDALKWRYITTLFALSQPPPQETWDRCGQHANFHFHPGAPIDALAMHGDTLRITTPRGVVEADFLILGTGLTVDLAQRPELAAIAPHAALWRDRFTPPPGQENATLAGFPYLGPDLAFTERSPGDAPWLRRVRSCSFGSLLSTISSAGISMLRPTVERMARGIAEQLFLEQAEGDHASLLAYAERELVSMHLASQDPRP